jgi:hypothetical protein
MGNPYDDQPDPIANRPSRTEETIDDILCVGDFERFDNVKCIDKNGQADVLYFYNVDCENWEEVLEQLFMHWYPRDIIRVETTA